MQRLITAFGSAKGTVILTFLSPRMHRSHFFSCNTDSSTYSQIIAYCILSTDPRPEIFFFFLLNLYSSQCGTDWDRSSMCEVTRGWNYTSLLNVCTPIEKKKKKQLLKDFFLYEIHLFLHRVR